MMITPPPIIVETLLPWSEGTNVATANGPRRLRKAILAKGTEFWAIWKSSKEELKELGVSVAKDTKGNWEARWWQNLDPKAAAAAQAAREESIKQRQAVRAAFAASLRPEQQRRLDAIADKLLKYQIEPVKQLIMAMDTFGGSVDASDTGCHAAGTEILMFTGKLKKVEDMQRGDLLMGWDGTPRPVIRTVKGFAKKMVRITPVKGLPFVVNEDHILTLVRTNVGRSHDEFRKNGRVVDVKVSEWMKWNKRQKHLHKLFRVGVNCWNEKRFGLQPYHLGIMLGDGCMVSKPALSLCKPGKEMKKAAHEIAADFGCYIVTQKDNRGSGDNPVHHFRQSYSLWEELGRLRLAGKTGADKFIPFPYKTANWEQRAQVLAGLLDTDGHYQNGGYQFCSISQQLAKDVAFVARSLGLAAYIHQRTTTCQTGAKCVSWGLFISGDVSILPLHIPYKKASVRKQKKNVLRTGFRVEVLPSGCYYGFEITGDGRYCMGDFTVTHNTGKTYSTLAAAIVLQRPVFVVCPKAVRPSWRKVARHFGISDRVKTCNYELLRRGGQSALDFLNPGKDEKFVWKLSKDTIIVFDEAHRLKDYRTYNCKMGLAAIAQGYHVMGLSATLADNPLQMKFAGNLCRLFQEKDFWKWTQDNGCAKGRWGYEFVGGNKVLQRLHEEIFPLHGSRIRIADLGDAFPETQITAEVYELNGNTEQLNSVYSEMDEEIARIEAKEEQDSEKQACILVAQLRARQRAEILKVPATAAMAKDLEEEGMSVAIFCNYDDTVNALMAKLGTDCVIRGGQTPAVREENIQRFQALRRRRAAIHFPTPSAQDAKQALGRVARAPDAKEPAADAAIEPSPFIICNIRAGGVGIGLHDLNGSKSIQRIFFAAGTIEELVCKQVQEKVNRIDMLQDGDLSLTGELRQQVFLPVKN